MKADLSRNTFDRTRHYSAVRLQQGRVVTDADWNEQADIARYRTERLARDTIGSCGAPQDAAGYRLVAETNALAVRALNANLAWVVAEDGALLTTSNGGADWTLADLATSAQLRALAQAGNAGWVVGDGGVVRKTSDAGASWSAQDSGTLRALRGVAAVDANRAWAVGDGGIVVSTIDGGAVWRLAQSGAARLYAVGFADGSNGVAVGQAGAIVATRDGGETWNSVASGTDAHLRAIARFGTTLVWAAGQDGTILRSEDGGSSWLPCATPSGAALNAIAFRDETEGWAVGEGGTVLHSVDGGATWQAEEADAGTATLRGLSVSGGDPGSVVWAVGDGGVALHLGIGSPEAARLALPAVGLSIEPGRCYVNGMLCELDWRTSYAHQPDGVAGERLQPGAWLLYLDAWQHHVSALEAPAIREVALGGPDTATRARTVAQVRALPLPAASPFDWSCHSSIEAWDALVGMPRPRLAARAEPQLAVANLCEIAATAGYRRLENQLYRVEVHAGGVSPSFKWSRENGSVAYAVVAMTLDPARQQSTVRVAARGRDANLDVAVHDRVELIDDDAALTQRAGTLFEYVADGDDELELVLAGVPTGALGQDPARHPVLRRWDHKPALAGSNVLPIVEGAWIDLEDGVQVRFEPGGIYRPGDYWQIPARTITADVEWPRDNDGDPVPREPAGIVDSYCRLGIVEVDPGGAITVTSDCREVFPPLTAFEQLLYVSGDGQQGAGGAQLAHPLEMRVTNGSDGVAGVPLTATVEQGGGAVVGPATVVTGPDGYASVGWRLGGAGAQRLVVRLADDEGNELQRLGFNASIVVPATAGGGCEITIGPGGQFERLDSALLARLLEQSRGALCLCFMPGRHEFDALEASGGRQMRLSLRACGPTAILGMRGGIAVSDFASVELRDLTIELGTAGVALRSNDAVRLAGVAIASAGQQEGQPCLLVTGSSRVSMVGCDIGAGPSASAVFDGMTGACRVSGNRFAGAVSFYGVPGAPGADVSRRLLGVLGQAPEMNLAARAPQLHFVDNSVLLLTIGEAVARQLMETRKAEGLFQTAALHGNTFSALGNVFASSLLSFDGNSFVAEPQDGAPYGVMIANRAAAAANVAPVFGDQAILHFLTPAGGGFRGAANQVFTLPQQ